MPVTNVTTTKEALPATSGQHITVPVKTGMPPTASEKADQVKEALQGTRVITAPKEGSEPPKVTQETHSDLVVSPDGSEKKVDQPKDNADLARINKLAREKRETEARLRQLSDEKAAIEAKARELEEFVSSAKKSPTATLRKLGFVDSEGKIDLKAITDAYLQEQDDPKAFAMKQKLDEVEDKLSSFEQRQKDAADAHTKRQRTAIEQQAKDTYLGEIAGMVSKDTEGRYEYAQSNPNAQQDAWELAEARYAATGRVPDPQSILDTLEDFYFEQSMEYLTKGEEALAKIKQTKRYLAKNPPIVTDTAGKKPAIKVTLGQAKTKPVTPPPADPNMTVAQRREAAIRWAQAELDKNRKR